MSRDDVVWCYRNLLGREPESDAAVLFHSRSKSFRDLVEIFVKSPEFRAIIGAKDAPQNQCVSPTVDADLVRVLRERHHVRSFEVAPPDSSPLCIRDDYGISIPVHLPADNVIGLSTLLTKQWDITKPRFVDHIVTRCNEEVLLIDVGANVGLFSRQCLSLTPKIAALYAYEPDPANFSLLCRNVLGIRKARLNNFGLGNKTSKVKLFLDPDNSGNCSLNVNAMPQRFASTSVDIVRAGEEQDKWLAFDIPIIYKSDTQGFDEVIATSLNQGFWERVRGGIFELWRIPGKDYEADSFARILDSFPNKVFDKNPQMNVSSCEVMQYLASTDHEFDDLLFWRD